MCCELWAAMGASWGTHLVRRTNPIYCADRVRTGHARPANRLADLAACDYPIKSACAASSAFWINHGIENSDHGCRSSAGNQLLVSRLPDALLLVVAGRQ